eukprot:Phypoly_transcript_03243.p1 GENE.Phypoly_transcript_03243~~Phypoly_transcript_03243.p1  ORF type:complete len:481 (+),score=51.08 Phypoly_transcript_03243:910-2352(+)
MGFTLLILYGSVILDIGNSMLYLDNIILQSNTAQSLLSIPSYFFLIDIFSSTKGLQKKVNVFFYICMLSVYFLTMEYVAEEIENDYLVTFASYSAWIAILSLCILVLSISSPILKLFCSYFKYDILYLHIQELHLNRFAAYNFSLFSLIHVTCHSYKWATAPFRVDVLDPNYPGNWINIPVYSFHNAAFITGVGMVVLFCLSVFKWHVPTFCAGLVCFYYHGYQQLLSSFYSKYVLIGALIICGLVHCALFISNRSMTVTIIPEQSVIQPYPRYRRDGTMIFLVVDPPSLLAALPGSNFTIFSTSKFLKRYNGSNFPLFSISQQRLAFFFFSPTPVPMDIQKIMQKMDHAKEMVEEKEVKISIVGPLHGPGSLLLEHIQNASPSVLFLCATGIGFVHIVSLVAYLKEKQLRRRLLKVYVFHHVTAIESESLNELFQEISRFHALGEVWESSQNNLLYFAKPDDDTSHITDFAFSKVKQAI